MGLQSKKYYYQQILEIYLFSKKILGQKCIKDHKFKRKVDNFDGYLRFDFDEEISFKNQVILTTLNNNFDDKWNKFHNLKINYSCFKDEIDLNRKSHIFYIILISLALILNIVLLCNLYFKSAFIIILGLLAFLLPIVVYIIRILRFKNKEKLIAKEKEKIYAKLDELRNQLIEILKSSPLYQEEDLTLYLSDYEKIEEKIPQFNKEEK